MNIKQAKKLDNFLNQIKLLLFLTIVNLNPMFLRYISLSHKHKDIK
jgi:hypothetical protein